MTEIVYLGLGSNMDNRENYLVKAVELLELINGFSSVRLASIYETPPLYHKGQPHFLNTVLEGTYDGSPEHLLREIQSVESQLDRPLSRNKNEPRTIDIDILVFGDTAVNSDMLQIPHPKMAERRFVLEPFAEIAPDFIIPIFNRNPIELMADCTDSSIIEKQPIPMPA